jgi:bleomycin hydrolase
MKKKLFLACGFLFSATILFAQTQTAPTLQAPQFFDVKTLKATPVKNQGVTGTCWCFSTTSFVESEEIRKENKEIELSEMFTVRYIYIEKAKNYILRGGKAQFGEGGLGHDEIRAVANYGAIPLNEYPGLLNGQKGYNHKRLFEQLQGYLDSILKMQPIANSWLSGYTKILDDNLGAPPPEFSFNGKKYSPLSFAKEVLHFNADDYVSLTSFTHQPYYQPFILQVPDNFANGSFYNLPLNEMLQVMKDVVNKGYTVAWDADVSNTGFDSNTGLALNLDNSAAYSKSQKSDNHINPDTKELPYDATIRQQLYENLTTQDDHLMHITGIEKSKEGKTFFVVKNSWGKSGPFEGYINVSEPYVAINTISIVVPKVALSKELLAKLNIK